MLNNLNNEETITFKRSHFFLALLPIAFVLGLGAGYIFWGLGLPIGSEAEKASSTASESQEVAQAEINSGDEQQEPTANVPETTSQGNVPQGNTSQGNSPQGNTPQPEFRRYDVPEDDDPSIGPDDAAITLIEFSDYECPYCRRWHQEVFDKILKDFPKELRIVYRDFPLSSIHPNAAPAAEAANCANEQGFFWEYSQKLYASEEKLSPEVYKKLADELSLDIAAFNKCVAEGRYSAEVQADYDYASNLGVRSTPTFFLNGIPVVGAQPYEFFKEIIEKELAGELPK